MLDYLNMDIDIEDIFVETSDPLERDKDENYDDDYDENYDDDYDENDYDFKCTLYSCLLCFPLRCF